MSNTPSNTNPTQDDVLIKLEEKIKILESGYNSLEANNKKLQDEVSKLKADNASLKKATSSIGADKTEPEKPYYIKDSAGNRYLVKGKTFVDESGKTINLREIPTKEALEYVDTHPYFFKLEK